MRVGLVVPGFSANAADWCIPALRHLVRTLAARDDVRVVATRYPYARARYAIDRADVIAIGGAASRGRVTLDLWRTTLQILRAEHREQPFDVLHAFWATESGLLTAFAGRWLGIPTLVSLAGGELVALPRIGYGDQRICWERLKVRASLRLASAVSAGSGLLLDLASRHVPHGKLNRAPLGVDLEIFRPRPSLAREPRLVHVGTLTPVKDQATLLRAFAVFAQRSSGASMTLDIVGDGPLRSEIQQQACDLGIADSVCFRGDVDHGALPDVYRPASAFVLSSLHEAQGMVALEAAACGLPIVGTRVGVIPELAAVDGVSPPGDADGLANAIAVTLADPSPRARFALERAQTEFALETCTARFRALYARLAEAQ